MLKAQMLAVKSESIVGNYRQRFFEFGGFDISEVKASSVLYSEDNTNPEYVIIKQNYSFCYLREDKLKLLDVYDKEGVKIEPRDFLRKFGIKIRSKNLFKTGKYLSRVFRPVKYGEFFYDLDVKINDSIAAEYVDGISLISLRVAKALGWQEAEANSSAQFTLFFNDGLVKGHCVVSDRIEHDVVIYGKENIKDEIAFMKKNLAYLSIEPVKLSERLNLDIQTMLNLWGFFGAEQYLLWASHGITKFKKDLMTGKLNGWLQYRDGKEEDEQWVLRKAINNGIDYRQYPALFRSAWVMFRNSMERYAEDSNGEPVFRIPVPCGLRAYIRIDLREHDSGGNFIIDKSNDKIEVDKFGNAWFGGKDFIDRLKILGGADQDDGIGIIRVKQGMAVIYRNPNQYGEYVLSELELYKSDECGSLLPSLKGTVLQKRVAEADAKQDNNGSNKIYPNNLVERFYRAYPTEEITPGGGYIKYNTRNLLKAYVAIARNVANIGYAANAEMVLSAIGIKDKELFDELRLRHQWNLEAIIDGTVKEGSSVGDEIEKITGFLRAVEERQIKLPAALVNRLPQSMRANIIEDENHELDMLLEAVRFIIEQADLEVLGSGTVSSGERIPGLIDTLNIPIEKFALNDENNPMYSSAMSILYEYNRKIAELLGEKEEKSEDELHQGIKSIQKNLLKRLNKYERHQMQQIVNAVAYQIYKSGRGVHDSILWIKGEEGYIGTADLMIELLAEKTGVESASSSYIVRLWSQKTIEIDRLTGAEFLKIYNYKCTIANQQFNIGDEHIGSVKDGTYRITDITPYRSRRNGYPLRNSVTIVIQSD